MEYQLLFMKSQFDIILGQLISDPFVMQAAFILTEVEKKLDKCNMFVQDCIMLKDEDYEVRLPDYMSFYSRILLSTMKTAAQKNKSIIFAHSCVDLAEGNCCQSSEDNQMLFRIAYAYMPFGVHASLSISCGNIAGEVWMPPPSLATVPLKINK